MFALQIAMPRFKSVIFYQNSPKIKLFFQKDAKFLITVCNLQTTDPQSSFLIANFWQRACSV